MPNPRLLGYIQIVAFTMPVVLYFSSRRIEMKGENDPIWPILVSIPLYSVSARLKVKLPVSIKSRVQSYFICRGGRNVIFAMTMSSVSNESLFRSNAEQLASTRKKLCNRNGE